MATGSTGAPHNIPFPKGTDRYVLAGDLEAMASQTAARLNALSSKIDDTDWSAAITALNAAAQRPLAP